MILLRPYGNKQKPAIVKYTDIRTKMQIASAGMHMWFYLTVM